MKLLITNLLFIVLSINGFSQNFSNNVYEEKKVLFDLNEKIEKFESQCFIDSNFAKTSNYDNELSNIIASIQRIALGIKGEPEHIALKSIIFETVAHRMDYLNYYMKLKSNNLIYKESYKNFKEIYLLLYSKYQKLE